MEKRILLALLLFILAFATGSAISGLFLSPAEEAEFTLVERVIDGDTLAVEGGERVRLIGVDTPEKGQPLFRESTAFLRGMVEGRQVRLERDLTERDKYGRLLRYVYAGDLFVNLELVRQGYASTLLLEPDTRYAELLSREESLVRSQGKGIWAFSPDRFCLGIFSLHFNARGDDRANLNDEYVVFRNKCLGPVTLAGWRLSDRSGAAFVFPDISVPAKSTLTLRTGAGRGNATDLFWERKDPVWNNNGDTLLLRDPQGTVMLNHTYP